MKLVSSRRPLVWVAGGLLGLVSAGSRPSSLSSRDSTRAQRPEPPAAAGPGSGDGGFGRCGRRRCRHRRCHRDPGLRTAAAALSVQLHRSPGRLQIRLPGLPTFGAPGTDFPDATAGRVLPVETRGLPELGADAEDTSTTSRPACTTAASAPSEGDVFVGGYAGGVGSDARRAVHAASAIDSNISTGEQPDVTIAYLTIQRFSPPVDQTAINQTGARGWRL